MWSGTRRRPPDVQRTSASEKAGTEVTSISTTSIISTKGTMVFASGHSLTPPMAMPTNRQ